MCLKLPGPYTPTAGRPDFFNWLFVDTNGAALAHGGTTPFTTPNMHQIFYPLNTRAFNVLYDNVVELSEANSNGANAFAQSFEHHAKIFRSRKVALNCDVNYGDVTSNTLSTRPTIVWVMLVEEDANNTSLGAMKIQGQHTIWYKDN
jgi:hypothetical protein